MSEYRSVLERAGSNAPSADLQLERVLRRRDRNRRNQRVAAGVVGIAVFAAAIWVLRTRVGQETTTPAMPPRVAPGDARTLEVATNFVAAFGAHDADRAITYLSDVADLTGLGAEGIREFRLLLSYLEAVGYRQLHTSCLDMGSSALGTYVHCTFDFHSNGSDEIGRSPFSGSSIHFTVRDGEIVRASTQWQFGKFGPQIWDPFKEWVSTNYPEDVAVMYEETYPGDMALRADSIRLWNQHTREYVEEVEQGGRLALAGC